MTPSGKLSDDLLDKISELRRNRDQTLTWLELCIESGAIRAEIGRWLQAVLRGEE